MCNAIKKILRVIIIVIFTMSITSCTKENSIHVLAASSLEDALTQVIAEYNKTSKTEIVVSYASSGQLAIQIENNAPADIFLSAGAKQTKNLADKAFAVETKAFLENRLVVAAKEKIMFEDILSQNIIAIGEPETVPAGQYAKEALENARLWEQANKKSVQLGNVREVLAAVESKNADIGFVYITDLTAAPELLYTEVPQKLYNKITYPAQLLKQSEKNDFARDFYDFLFSKKAQEIFNKYNFASAE